MTASGNRARWLPGVALLAAALAVGVGIRIGAIGVPGHNGDVLVVSRWAERMAEVGPLAFYQDSSSIYPALLYVYWPLGIALNGDALDTAIKALSIPFDALVGVLLFSMLARRVGPMAGAGAAALYLLNPAVILAGPVWGQIDAAGTLVLLASLLAASNSRFGLAAALAMLAGLVKPQFGLVLLPVLIAAVIEWRRHRDWRPLGRAGAGAAMAYLLVAGPLLLNPVQLLAYIAGGTDIRPEFSVYAPNPWALIFGYEVPDTGWTPVGGALLLAGLGASLLALRWPRNLRTWLAVGAMVVFAFYFLPTRVHERYLFPAMAVLAPLAAVSWRLLAPYLAMTVGFTLSLLYALADTTPFSLPQDWEEVLITPAMVSALSIVLTVAALSVIVLLWTGAGRRLAVSAPREPPR